MLRVLIQHQRIRSADKHIKQFRFIWDGLPLQPPVGVSYCCVRVLRLATLSAKLGELLTSSPLTHQRAGEDLHAMRRNAPAARFEGQNCDDESPATGVGARSFFLMAQPIFAFVGRLVMKFYCDSGMTTATLSTDNFTRGA